MLGYSEHSPTAVQFSTVLGESDTARKGRHLQGCTAQCVLLALQQSRESSCRVCTWAFGVGLMGTLWYTVALE